MTPLATATGPNRPRLCAPAVLLMLSFAASLAGAGEVGPGFSKEFLPETIGPGSTSMLVFTINNVEGPTAVTGIAFTDNLPAGVTLASPALVSNSCKLDLGGSLSAPNGGTTISLAGGRVGANAFCRIVVNVTSSTPGTHMNTTSTLTSSVGSSGPATDDLTVTTELPGFSKSFSPSTVALGGRSTLTFTIDNTASATAQETLDFVDVLPPGMVVAGPANASSTCGTAVLPPTVVANPGGSTITLDADGTVGFPAVPAGGSCLVKVDVIGGAVGLLGNVSGELLAGVFLEQSSAGKAAAVLEVTGSAALLSLRKEFVDDPVAPGGTATLQFTVSNRSRDEAATGIAFSDDLDAVVTGLAPTLPPTPDPPCGVGSSLAFLSGVLTLSGGDLAPGASCVFSVTVTVPPGAPLGTYVNSAGPVTGTVAGEPETGNVASDLLFVVGFPLLTKEFTNDPVAAGDTLTVEFTISNPTTSGMSGITFVDEVTDNSGQGPGVGNGFLPFPVSATLPGGSPCGGSVSLVSLGSDRQGIQLSGGSLAANGSVGDECSFSVDLDVPLTFPGGSYLNTTEPIRATLDDEPGTPTAVGKPASATAVIAGAPNLSKEFTDDPVLPSGGPVTLEFNLVYEVDEDTPDATSIAFSDDLTTLFAGLVAASVDVNTCSGAVVDISTPTLIDVSGGTLTAGESCTISLTLTVPSGAPIGFHTNITSDITAVVDGVATANAGAIDDLLVTPLVFTKEFLDGGQPVIPGDTVVVRFTIVNNGTSPSEDATSLTFSDSWSGVLPGLDATGPPSVDTCGGSVLASPGSFLYFGGSVGFGSSCTIEVELLVPAGTADGDYLNATSSLTGFVGPTFVTIPPARDVLSVNSTLIGLTKEFIGDPVLPEDTLTLQFDLVNLSTVEAISDIAFSDDLDAALSGLEAIAPVSNTCGGMAGGFPAGLFTYGGGSLAPGGSCTIAVTVEVPPAPLPGSFFLNTTSAVTGKVGALDVTGEPASDTLEVQLLTFTKTFDDPTVAGATLTLEFELTNLGTGPVVGLAFSDDLDAVLAGLAAVPPPVPDPPCGPGSSLAGTSFLAFTDGSLPASGSCTFSVTVQVPDPAPAGDFLNTTSELFQSGLPVAAPATDFLTIEPPPLFAKEFAPDVILEDEVSTLTFTIDNGASALAATGLDFTDVFPAGVVVATPANASTTCTGGTLTALSGTGSVSYTGGSVAAGASCTVQVDVTSTTASVYVNTSGDLTSSSGNSGAAGDTLTVEPAEADLELVKTAVFEPVMGGRLQHYVLTVTNLGPGDAETVVLTDVLPAGVVPVLSEPIGSCTEAPAGVLTCALGDLEAGKSATVRIQVYVKPVAADSMLDNLASVTSDTVDPVPANNDVSTMTKVIPLTGVAALADVDGGGFPEIAVPLSGPIEVLVKDADTKSVVHLTPLFPAAWAVAGFEKKPGINGGLDDVVVLAFDTVFGAAAAKVVRGSDGAVLATLDVPAGFQPLALAVIANDGTDRTLVAIAGRRLADGRNRIFLYDAALGGPPFAEVALSPLLWPIDLAGIEPVFGDPPTLAVVGVNTANGGRKLKGVELPGGVPGVVQTAGLPASFNPAALDFQPNSAAVATTLAVLGRNPVSGNVGVRVVVGGGAGLSSFGAFVSVNGFATGATPTAVATVPDIEPDTADEVAALYRNSIGRAAARVRSLLGVQFSVGGFGPPATGSIPLGLAVAPSYAETAAGELVVYWEDAVTGARTVTVRDASSGAVVKRVPIP